MFGGTFDPVHEGHLRLADTAWREGAVREVVFIPSGKPSHKPTPRASAAHRLEMLRLALAGRRYCRVDDSEIGLESPRYSHDTIAAANRLRGGRGVAFLLGEDSLHDVPGWRMGWRLLEMCPFITQRRASGTGRPVPPSGVGSPGSNRRRVLWLKRPGLPVSSTEIRAIVHAGHALEGRVPAAVAEYIAVHRLYS